MAIYREHVIFANWPSFPRRDVPPERLYKSDMLPDIYSEEELAALKKDYQKWTADDATSRSKLHACIANAITWEHQQYEKAARELEKRPNAIQNLDEFAPPPEFWLGNRAIREKLGELWQQYHSVKGE